MPTQNVNLSEQQARFIRRRVRNGGYRNASEVVRAGLRLLEQQERQDKLKLDALRRIAAQAFEEIERGEFVTVGPDAIDEFLESVDERAEARNSP